MNHREHATLAVALAVIESDGQVDNYEKAINSLKGLLATQPIDNEQRNFRWAYSLLLALAKRCLKDLNDARENENDWPAGQEWDEINGSSKSIFLRKAREEAGIPHDEFLAGIRSGEYDVDDLYGD